jgi:MoaA/NifB/PqqE/SkfB family radical SAM enzyme
LEEWTLQDVEKHARRVLSEEEFSKRAPSSSSSSSAFTSLRFLLTVLKSNLGELSKPYKLNFAVTYWCQSRCLTCNIWRMRPKNELSLEEIQEFAKKNPYLKWIAITGGEPFVRNDLSGIIRAFHENCENLYVLSLTTNSLCAVNSVEKAISEILKLKIPRFTLTLSLDGYEDVHDKVRGVPGNYRKVLSLYSRLRSLSSGTNHFRILFGYTMSRFNLESFFETLETVREEFPEITIDDFYVNVAQYSESFYRNSRGCISPDKRITAAEIRKIYHQKSKSLMTHPSLLKIMERAYTKHLIRFVEDRTPRLRCRGLDASCFLDSFGNVYPSIMWDRKIGNVRDTQYDLTSVLRSRAADDARGELEPDTWTSSEANQSMLGSLWSLI